MSTVSGQAKVVPASMEAWESELDSMVNDLLDEVNEFIEESNNLQNNWVGTSAEGFLSQISDYEATVVPFHEKMKESDSFLSEVVSTMEQQ